ncbi:MAG: HAD family hydrolase [Thermoleophilia bacterium]
MSLDPRRVRAVLFDVDGTLRDTDDEMIDRGVRFLVPLVGRARAPEAMRAVVVRLENTVQRFVAQADRWDLDGPVNRLLARALPAGHGGSRAVPGALEAVEALAPHLPLGIVSAGPASAVMDFTIRFGVVERFGSIMTGLSCRHTKPWPDPVLAAAAQLGVAPEFTLMVGDSPVDIRAGHAAGAQAVGVTTGFGTRARLEKAGAEWVVDDMRELAEVLLAGLTPPPHAEGASAG